MIEALIHKFNLAKAHKPTNFNELLDFVQKEYVEERLSIREYRNLLRELTAYGAAKPFYKENWNQKTKAIPS